ncbi:MAG: sigma-70 family RNA polymerase sigma factor [Sedimentisphaerales bacterium]|nr:sigma-70 family RNA polymerase sigma factor [Sedimentisphaerales bacterium]
MAEELNIQAIRQAQAGNMQSLSAVAEQVRQKVYTYIYRLTLNYHLTQDLTQETVLEMIRTLGQLNVPHMNGFWAWVFRTALGKVQHHFRPQGARRVELRTTADTGALESRVAEDNDPADAVVNEEIKDAVLSAMLAIKCRYRNILVLRCLDNLSYGQIAGIMGGSELKARLLFCRAKHSLRSQLERHGLKRDSLLAALAIFAGLTVRSGKKAAAKEVVLPSSLEAGLGLSFAGLMSVKAALAAVCVFCLAGFMARMVKPEPSARMGVQELYAPLYALFEREEFVKPSHVIGVRDPDRNGFLVIDQDRPRTPVQRLPADQIHIDLVNQPRMGLVLSKGHWIEVGFDGPLRDGPGPDILLREWGCRGTIAVFLTDGRGQSFTLPPPQCWRLGICRNEHIIDYDLDGLDLPFEPRAVRLHGLFDRFGRHHGVEFLEVRARILRTER